MIRFKIIDTFNLTKIGAVVLAECMDSQHDFDLSDSAILGEASIKPVINSHKKVEEAGNIVRHLFTFQLNEIADKDKFQKGDIVLLKP